MSSHLLSLEKSVIVTTAGSVNWLITSFLWRACLDLMLESIQSETRHNSRIAEEGTVALEPLFVVCHYLWIHTRS